MKPGISVAIFAYNEAANIAATLDSVLANLPDSSPVHVLANGCTDGTVPIVRQYEKHRPQVVLLEIKVADKCNAWNTYVHEVAGDSAVHFFMDGDVQCSPKAFERMREALESKPGAHAVAGMPLSGRGKETYQGYVRDRGWLFGNLYGVRHEHLQRLRENRVFLPLGLRGNDHFITRFMQSDLEPTWEEHKERVAHHPEAGYVFKSLQWWRPRDLNIYWKRSVTYRWRELQLAKIWDIPLRQLPRTMDGINQEILRDLLSSPLKATDWRSRKVLDRLRRMYPTADAEFYATMLGSEASRRPSTPNLARN